jgi:hypothetical protein
MSEFATIEIKGKRSHYKGPRITKRVHASVSASWDRCAREALRTMFLLMRDCHEDTGMSIGTLVPMGRILKVAGLQGYIGTGKVRRARTKEGIWYAKNFHDPDHDTKSISSGLAVGRYLLASKQMGIYYGSPQRAVFTFRVTIGTLQHALHEVGIVSPRWSANSWKSPKIMDSLGRANKTFMKQFKTEMRKLKRTVPALVAQEMFGGLHIPTGAGGEFEDE